MADKPTGRRVQGAGQVSYDHWDAIFEKKLAALDGQQQGDGKRGDTNRGPGPKAQANAPSKAAALEDAIAEFRREYGDAKWKEAELDELAQFRQELGGDRKEDLVWEDVRAEYGSRRFAIYPAPASQLPLVDPLE